MPRYVAFLRAINVGGHVVKMDLLRSLFADLGLANVETFIASGNVIFETSGKKTEALEQRVEEELKSALGYEVATFIRTLPEVRTIASWRPFPEREIAEARAFSVGLLKEPLARGARQALGELETDVDAFEVRGRELYWLCRAKQNESKFTNAVFERKAAVRATFRGMNTMERLARKYPA